MDFLGVLCCAVELCSLCRISMTGIEPRTTYVKQRWFELMIMQTLNRRASYLKYNCNLECIILRQRVYLCDFQWICQSLKCQIGTNTNEMRCSVTYRRCLEFKKNDFKIYFTIQIENRWCARVRVSSFPPANRIPNDMGDNANKHVLDILMIANGNLNLDICTDWITLNLHVVMYSNRWCVSCTNSIPKSIEIQMWKKRWLKAVKNQGHDWTAGGSLTAFKQIGLSHALNWYTFKEMHQHLCVSRAFQNAGCTNSDRKCCVKWIFVDRDENVR